MELSRSFVLACALQSLGWLAACRAPADQASAPPVPSRVYTSSDHGETWHALGAGLPASIGISDLAADDSQLVLATKRGGIFSFDAEGNRWQRTATSPRVQADVDAVALYRGAWFAGTHGFGAWVSFDSGKTWQPRSEGLGDLTVRKLVASDGALYAATNAGLFELTAASERWVPRFVESGLQANGLAADGRSLYLASQRGMYRFDPDEGWKHVLADRSIHNVAIADRRVYAMVYNELFVSNDRGGTWRSAQAGMPADKYTFQVRDTGAAVLAGQWDGVYRLTPGGWQRSGRGIPSAFAATELARWRERIVVASSTLPSALTR